MLAVAGYADPGVSQLQQLTFTGGGAWTPIPITGDPPGGGVSAVLDYARNRGIVFSSGQPAIAFPITGTPVWSYIGASQSLELRDYAVAIFDTEHDRSIYFGGYGQDTPTNYFGPFDDVWSFAASTSAVSLSALAFRAPVATSMWIRCRTATVRAPR